MKYLSLNLRPHKRVMIHGGLWTNMNLPRIHVGYDLGGEYVAFDYGNDGSDPVIGVSIDLVRTRAGKILGDVCWWLYQRRHR